MMLTHILFAPQSTDIILPVPVGNAAHNDDERISGELASVIQRLQAEGFGTLVSDELDTTNTNSYIHQYRFSGANQKAIVGKFNELAASIIPARY